MRPATLPLLLAAAVLRCTAENPKNTSAPPPLVAYRVDRPALDPSVASLVDTTSTVSAVLVVLGGAGSVGSAALVGKLAIVSSLSCFSVAYPEADPDAASPPAAASPLPYPPFDHPLLFPVHGALHIHPNPMASTLVSVILLNSLSLFVVAAATYASRLWLVPRVRGTVLEGPAQGLLLVAYFILLPGTVLASATLALSPSLPYAGGTAVAADGGGAAELVAEVEVHVRMLGIIGAVACIATAALLLKLIRRQLVQRAELVPDPLLASIVSDAAGCGGASLRVARSDESEQLQSSTVAPTAVTSSPAPIPSTQRAWERRFTGGRRRREAYTFVWGRSLWVDKEDGDGFVAETGGVFGGYHEDSPWYVAIESLSLIALAFTLAWDGADGDAPAGGGGGGGNSTAASSPSRPPLESDSLSCTARCVALAVVLGGNFLLAAFMQPHISPLQNLHASVGHFLLFAFAFTLCFSDWADGSGFAGGGAAVVIVLASCLILAKAVFDVVAKLCELCLLRRWRFRSSSSARRTAATRAANRRRSVASGGAEAGGAGRGRSYSAISLVEVEDDDDTIAPALLRTGSSQAPVHQPQQTASRGSLVPPVWGDPSGAGSDARSPAPSPAASVSPASAAHSLPPRARRMSNVGSVCGSERVSVNSTSPAPRARRGESWRAEAAAAANAVPGVRQTGSWRAGGPSRTGSLVSSHTAAEALRRKLSGGLRSGGGSENNTPRTHLSARNLKHLEGGGAVRGTAGLSTPGQLKDCEVVESEGGSSMSE